MGSGLARKGAQSGTTVIHEKGCGRLMPTAAFDSPARYFLL
ncbi:hypothetical protein NK6_3874 [Bradyrhizobium diazoefficiens]|jgi:hypothetical protein|uniref:Uncharacterized protein n=1 Tax=Bradyrhizobium diazoefficiens TaxID=1355477 RepID=A0A0E4FTR8_9BRAD|nr:hypothetical protein NK6_3874 [Bradyrhizobium diazoefficiens]